MIFLNRIVRVNVEFIKFNELTFKSGLYKKKVTRMLNIC